MQSHELTYDQKKAAEAAFRGNPPDPKWSVAARSIYEGIAQALAEQGHPPVAPPEEVELESPHAEAEHVEPAPVDTEAPLLSREEAIQAGILVDVTAVAHAIGLRLPVSMSRPLWDIGITASNQVTHDEYNVRVRDVLLALRLHLESADVTSPWIKFPALLSFPPDSAPQVCSLYAVAHRDPSTPYSLTLLLPHELSSLKQPEGR